VTRKTRLALGLGLFALGLLGTTAGGCAVAGAPRAVPVSLPASHRDAPTASPAARSLGDLAWFEVFSDPVLARLVREALARNDDLRIAAARVAEARALTGVERSALFPQVDGQLGVTRTGTSEAALFGFGTTRTVFSASAPISWEIDLFGRDRWATTAAASRWLETVEERNDLHRLLVADVVQAYLELRALDEEREIAVDTAETRGGTRDLFSKRLKGGSGSRVEVARAEAELALAEQAVPAIERRISQKENQIGLLLARNPGPIERGSPDGGIRLPSAPVDLPSALLRRRPDVRAAEAAVWAAAAEVGVARADRWPRLSLRGLLGLESVDLADIGTAQARTWSLGAGLVAPLFDGGRRQEEVRAAWARWESARGEYERTVRTALREVADALVAAQKLREAAVHAQTRAEALEEATRLAIRRYEGDAASYFEVLDAQRELFPARLELVRVRSEQRVAVVQLVRALGGGWDATGEAPCAPPPPAAAPAAPPPPPPVVAPSR
jgi:multidrug efflux system outer membrane protein